MNAKRYTLLLAVFFFHMGIFVCANAFPAGAAATTDTMTPSRGKLHPADMPVSKTSYIVKQGDSLGKILRTVFTLPDAAIFSPQTTLSMQMANPHIHNLNALKAGEKLFVPADILRQSPHAMASDAGTEIETSVQDLAGRPALLTEKKRDRRRDIDVQSPGRPASNSLCSQAFQNATGAARIQEIARTGTDALQHQKQITSLLTDFMHAFDGYDNTSCMKTLQLDNGGAIVIDCSKVLVYEFPWGARIVFDYGSNLPAAARKAVSEQWQHTKIITAGYNEKAEAIISRVIDGTGLLKNSSGNRYTVSRDDIQISVNGDWIVYKDHMKKNIFVITVVNDQCVPVPESLQAYLTGLGVTMLQVSPLEKNSFANKDPFSPEIKCIRLEDDPVKITDKILELLGITTQKNVKTKITPHNTRGITFEVTIDRKFQRTGKVCFIDFKNLSSNIISVLNNKGSKIIQIDSKTNDYMNLIHELLDFCSINHSTPVHFQYDYFDTASIEISIPGFLLHTKYGDFLLTNLEIDKNILIFLSEIDVKIIKF